MTVTATTRAVTLEQFGAAGDALHIEAGLTTTSGSATLTANRDVFTADMVGRSLLVRSAAAGNTNLITTVAGYTSPTQITMAVNAGVAQADTSATVGTDDGPALTAALEYLRDNTEGYSRILLGPNKYLLGTSTGQISFLTSQRSDIVIEGSGYESQFIVAPFAANVSGYAVRVVNARHVVLRNFLVFSGSGGQDLGTVFSTSSCYKTTVEGVTCIRTAIRGGGIFSMTNGDLLMILVLALLVLDLTR